MAADAVALAAVAEETAGRIHIKAHTGVEDKKAITPVCAVIVIQISILFRIQFEFVNTGLALDICRNNYPI
jgi:hypothetical protein